MIDAQRRGLPALDGQYDLSDACRDAFARKGHAVLPGLATAEEVIFFADGALVTEPDSAYQSFDLGVWLPGLEPGDAAASEINPLLWSRSD